LQPYDSSMDSMQPRDHAAPEVDVIAFGGAVELCELPLSQARQPTCRLIAKRAPDKRHAMEAVVGRLAFC
jgi:hypothetical protein